MNIAFLILAVLFLIGGVGFLIIGRKLSTGEKRQNWIKYFTYLLIVIIVLGSILIDRKLFIALIIIINSVGIIEMMLINKNSDLDHSGKIILFRRAFIQYFFFSFSCLHCCLKLLLPRHIFW